MEPKEKIERLCRLVKEKAGSDLLLNDGEQPRARLDGDLVVLEKEAVESADLKALSDLCGVALETVVDRDTHFTDSSGRRFRVNFNRQLGKWGAVLRLVHERVPGMEQLGLPAELLQEWAGRRAGLVLVAGPTGSGKSTTVASVLQWFNSQFSRHVVTIEEPVEYLFESEKCLFTQREVPTDTPTFASGLRFGVRQSPDVIFVGEIRDFETAEMAIQAAETGHLVISTVHSGSVAETLDRLTHLTPMSRREEVLLLLSVQLIGIVSQQLLPRVGGGRVLAMETFQNEGATRGWIRKMDYDALVDFMATGKNPANATFLQSIEASWRDGLITEEVATAHCPNPNDLHRMMKGVKGSV